MSNSIRRSLSILHHFLPATLLLSVVAPARAADAAPQVWLISTRSAPRCGDLDATPPNLRYWRMGENCRWSPANADALHADDDATLPTVVFIHGNRTDAGEAVTKAWYAYEVIRAQAAGRPFRYVIWSWPADRVCRHINDDARVKVAYSDAESYYLAQWLDRRRPGAKVSLIGHSLGPRIITGALHLLGGGEVAGRSLPKNTVEKWSGGKRLSIRAVLLACAIDSDCFAPGGCHASALSVVDEMLVTRNGCDRVLRWYPRLRDDGGSQAMGFVGPCGLGDAKNVDVIDVSCTVGKIHDWRNYCSAANVCNRLPHYTFLEGLPAQDSP